MSNDYFDNTQNRITNGTTARAPDVNNVIDAVSAAFDLLPTPESIWGDTASTGVTGGTVNAIQLTIGGSTPIPYVNGQGVVFLKLSGDNTGACTLAIDSGSPKPLVGFDGSALIASDLVTGRWYQARFTTLDDEWRIVNDVTTGQLDAAVTSAETAATNAANSASSAAAASLAAFDEAGYAQEWAQAAEDTPVSVAAGGDGVTDFSALHWAAKTEAFAADILDGFALNGTDIVNVTGGIVVSSGDSGVTTPNTDEDDLVIEGSTDVGISILSPNTQSGAIVFGDPENNDVGNITYQHAVDNMNFAAGATQLFRLAGTTGNIILGGITSDALGAESGSVTISTGDSGATTAGTEADDLIIENTDTGMTIFSASTGFGQIKFGDPLDNSAGGINYSHSADAMTFKAGSTNMLRLDGTNNNVLVGNSFGDLNPGVGGLVISTGDSGATSAVAGADDLIIESSGDAGLTVLCPDLNIATVKLGTPSDTGGAHLKWDYTQLTASVGSINTGGQTVLLYGNGSYGAKVDSTGRFIAGDTDSDALGAEAGSITISTGDSGVSAPSGVADDLVIENDTNGGINLLCPNTSSMNISWGDPEDNDVGKINYTHVTNTMTFTANGAANLQINADGSLDVSSVTDYETLVTDDDDIPNKKYVDDKYTWLVIAEESAPLDTATNTGYQWAFGNGENSFNGPAMPIACEVTHLTLSSDDGTAITATIQLVKNGTPVAGATLALTAAVSGVQVLGTPVSFAAGDNLTFVTTVGTAQGNGSQATALCRST